MTISIKKCLPKISKLWNIDGQLWAIWSSASIMWVNTRGSSRSSRGIWWSLRSTIIRINRGESKVLEGVFYFCSLWIVCQKSEKKINTSTTKANQRFIKKRKRSIHSITSPLKKVSSQKSQKIHKFLIKIPKRRKFRHKSKKDKTYFKNGLIKFKSKSPGRRRKVNISASFQVQPNQQWIDLFRIII